MSSHIYSVSSRVKRRLFLMTAKPVRSWCSSGKSLSQRRLDEPTATTVEPGARAKLHMISTLGGRRPRDSRATGYSDLVSGTVHHGYSKLITSRLRLPP